jgi:hypothetical protein
LVVACPLVAWTEEQPPAAASEPLYAKNLSPFAGLFGLPSQRSAFTTPARTLDVALHTSIANNYVLDSNARELVNLDGETLRFALDLRFGVAENWDVQLEVPWLDHSGGELDKLIDDWHDLWGMSDGGRSKVPRDLLDFRYLSNDGEARLLEDASGVGDVTLSTGYAFYDTGDAAATAVLGYKFGTGDDEDFTGSGSDDWFLALRLSGDHLADLPLSWHGQMGYLRAGDSDVVEDFQERNLWFAGIAMDWRFARNWSAILQLDSHEGPLDSDLTATGDEAFLLTVGGRWRFARNWSVDISVIEDIRVESAPDVTFQASLRFRGDRG